MAKVDATGESQKPISDTTPVEGPDIKGTKEAADDKKPATTGTKRTLEVDGDTEEQSQSKKLDSKDA